jgi:multidrug transporter EmrE-like cation transporter
VGYQVAAKKTAGTLLHVPFGPGWLAQALHLPWGQALIGLEIASFVAWMTVLSEIKLSAAFPLSAFSYVLVIATSWIVFREPADLTQFLGGAGILVGVWLIGRGEPN